MKSYKKIFQEIKKPQTVADKHQYKILIDTIKNPLKGKFLGGPTEEEAIEILKNKYGYTDADIEKLRK